jgi:gliding motility-associated-like protein
MRGSLQLFTDFSMSIYDRWGQLVYKTEDIATGCDGTRNGTPQELGNYFYLVTLKYKGELQEIKGDVNLIR